MQDVALARLDLGEVVLVHDLAEDDEASDDHRRPRGLEAAHALALGESERREVGEHPLRGSPREPMPVDPGRVVLGEAEVDRRGRGDRAGDTDRALDIELG